MENPLQPNSIVPSGQVPQGAQLKLDHYTTELDQQNHLLTYWEILKKRKWWFWGVFLGVVLLVGLYTFLQTPVYRSTTVLQIARDNTSSLVSDQDPTGLSGLSGWYGTDRFYETQFSILNSKPMAYRIIDKLNLQEHPQYKRLRVAMPDKSPQEIKSLMANLFMNNLEVKPFKKSYLVEISFRSPDKYLAQQVPNTMYREYVNFSMETRHHSYKLIMKWLKDQLQQFVRKLESSERRMYEHGQKKDFLSLTGKQNNVIVRKYTELSQLLTRAQAERTLKEAQLKQVQERGADAPLIVNNPLILGLRQEKIGQEAKVNSLAQIYDINYPHLQAEKAKLKELNARLKGEVKRLLTSIRSDYEAALRAENLLKEAVEEQKKDIANLQDNLVEHHILKRDLKTNEQLYQALLSRMKETSIASTMVSGNVAIIAPAELPLRTYSPKVLLNILLAIFFGLVGGFGAAFLADYLDHTINTTDELERFCRIPSLGIIPALNRNNRGLPKLDKSELELATFKQPRSFLSEAIYHLRTSLFLSMSGGPPMAIMVTSPNPSEGKTTVAINLATSMAMNNRKVVLIDCDLRKPSMHSVFQKSLMPGLSNYLTGNAVREEIIQQTFVPNLAVIPAGPVAPNPVELLTSHIFHDLLIELRQEFQHLVIDTPPVLGFADGRAIATQTDGVIIVVKYQSTKRDAGLLAMNLLTNVNALILGGVLNMTDSKKLGYGNYKGYYKYYNQFSNLSDDVKQIGS